MMTGPSRYRTADVPVRGGDLRVGIWEPAEHVHGQQPELPTILLIHGVTASHRSWLGVAERLTAFRVVAPDLRARGRSSDLPGPFGMHQHADDVSAVLEYLRIPNVLVVGHSMGGFVSVALNFWHGGQVRSLILVDGGLPLISPPGMSQQEAIAARLGPVRERLSMTFPDRESYQQFFRAHPAFAGEWNEVVTDYIDYDLVGQAPNLAPATSMAALTEDSIDQELDNGWLLDALGKLPDATPFLRAPRDLLNREPGLYPPDWIRRWQQRFTAVHVHDVPGVNHYTILFGRAGMAAVVTAIEAAAG